MAQKQSEIALDPHMPFTPHIPLSTLMLYHFFLYLRHFLLLMDKQIWKSCSSVFRDLTLAHNGSLSTGGSEGGRKVPLNLQTPPRLEYTKLTYMACKNTHRIGNTFDSFVIF